MIYGYSEALCVMLCDEARTRPRARVSIGYLTSGTVVTETFLRTRSVHRGGSSEANVGYQAVNPVRVTMRRAEER
jgi:hypothetical protein